MATYYCYAGAAGGGNGSAASPWNSLTTAITWLNANLAGGTAAAGSKLILRGTFVGGPFTLQNIRGTQADPFTIEGDSAYPHAVIDGNYTYPANQLIRFNRYRTGNATTGPIVNKFPDGSVGYKCNSWKSLLESDTNCRWLKIKHLIVQNSTAKGIGLMCGYVAEDVRVLRTLLSPIVCARPGEGANWADPVIWQDGEVGWGTLLNYRMAHYDYPTLGGVIMAGENGKTSPVVAISEAREFLRMKLHNSWSEGINMFSVSGPKVHDCQFWDNFAVQIYLHNSEYAECIGNEVWISDQPEGWGFPVRQPSTPAAMVYPGYATSLFSWESAYPSGAFPLANPCMTGGAPQQQSGITVGSEFPQTKAGLNTKIINNRLYRCGITEYRAGVNSWPATDPGTGAPWWSPNSLSNTGMIIAHNTIVAGVQNAGLSLKNEYNHSGGRFVNNIIDQDPATVSPGFKASEFAPEHNIYRLAPIASVRGATDLVADPLLKKGAPAGGEFWDVRPGSPAIKAGVVIAGITTDSDGVTRSATPTIGSFEFPEPPVGPPIVTSIQATEKIVADTIIVYVEGGGLTTAVALAEIMLAEYAGGPVIEPASIECQLSDNEGNAIDDDVATSATTTAACRFTLTYDDPRVFTQLRIKYPPAALTTHAGPTRVACLAKNPISWGLDIPLGEEFGILPEAEQIYRLDINNQLGQRRGLRSRAVISA